MASALLFSTVNRGLQELAIFDVQDTLKGLAEPLIPQPFNQGKVFYRVVSVSGQHSTRSTTGQRKRKRDDDKGPGHEEVGNGQEAGDDTSSFKLDDDDLVALAQAVAKTTELHCVERTFACLGFQTFSHTHTANRQRAWTEDATRQLLNDLLKAPDWKWALKAWTCARNWRPDRPAPTPPPTFRVSLRFRGGTATRKPRQNNDQSTPTNLYNQLVSRISSFFLDHASLALPPSTSQPWKPSLQTYDLEIWVHINDDGIVMGLPLRPGRNVYRNTTQKQEKGGLREAAAWSVAKMGLNSFPHATVVLDPCCGLGTVIGQCKGIKGSSSLCFAGDLDEGVVVEAKKKLSDVDFLIWDFRSEF